MTPFWILLEIRVMEVVSGDNWSYSIRRAMLQSNRHHQQTNIQLFTIDAIPDAQPTALKH